jgi:beta-mannosidase
LIDFAGKVLWQADPETLNSFQNMNFSVKEILGNADPASVVLVSTLIKDGQIIDKDLHYFAKPKNLKLVDPQLKTEILEKDEIIEISVTSTYLAKNVFLCADSLEEQFSDNFFDILPGETVVVTIPKKDQTMESIYSLTLLEVFTSMNH